MIYVGVVLLHDMVKKTRHTLTTCHQLCRTAGQFQTFWSEKQVVIRWDVVDLSFSWDHVAHIPDQRGGQMGGYIPRVNHGNRGQTGTGEV